MASFDTILVRRAVLTFGFSMWFLSILSTPLTLQLTAHSLLHLGHNLAHNVRGRMSNFALKPFSKGLSGAMRASATGLTNSHKPMLSLASPFQQEWFAQDKKDKQNCISKKLGSSDPSFLSCSPHGF